VDWSDLGQSYRSAEKDAARNCLIGDQYTDAGHEQQIADGKVFRVAGEDYRCLVECLNASLWAKSVQ